MDALFEIAGQGENQRLNQFRLVSAPALTIESTMNGRE